MDIHIVYLKGRGIRMKKHISWLTMLFVALFYIAPSVLNETSNERGEEQFLQGAIFDEASERFDIHAMGISKDQQILAVRTFNADLTDEIEVYADEKDGLRN